MYIFPTVLQLIERVTWLFGSDTSQIIPYNKLHVQFQLVLIVSRKRFTLRKKDSQGACAVYVSTKLEVGGF